MAAERIDADVINVVDRYISVEIVKRLNSDAGWRGFGQYEEGSGGGSDSSAGMIYQIQMVYNIPQDEKTAWSCRAMALLEKQSSRKHDALVSYVILRNRPDEETERDYHTNERIAQLVGMSRSAFDNNLKAGQEFIKDLLTMNRLNGKFALVAA